LGSCIYLANLNSFETPARDVHGSKPGQRAIEEEDKNCLRSMEEMLNIKFIKNSHAVLNLTL
jgi:hypothetical protein